MLGWTGRNPRAPHLVTEPDSRPLLYRAEVRSRDDEPGGAVHLYDGGEFSPYCIESLLDLLRSETRTTRRPLEMSFEILGACSAPRLEEVAGRFADASIPGLSVTVRAAGHQAVRVGGAVALPGESTPPPAPPRSS
jgi:hypothetical protein